MATVLSLLLRAFVLAAGLVFAASLVLVFALLLAAWAARAGWARLTGRRATPFVMRADPRAGFAEFMRRRAPAAATVRTTAPGRGGRDVSDVDFRPR